uniref:Uncharacterized protein n=1 Tax=Arundo donax TaxID=35708 RepID=A0A0A9EAI4_ARUDO
MLNRGTSIGWLPQLLLDCKLLI